MSTLVLLTYTLSAMLLMSAAHGQLTQEVTPSCQPDATECEFHWTITKQETMVYYDRSLEKGYPVLERDGTLYRRLPDNCTDLEPLTDEQLRGVATADGRYRVAYFINNHMPGPNIVVYKGQQVIVHVYNSLLQEGTSIHWHGQTQYNTPWMDGVASITQCSIEPQETFTYRFLATETGTHWYHSHYGAQRTDGFFGALIVLDKDERDRNRTPKDTVGDNKADERRKRAVRSRRSAAKDAEDMGDDGELNISPAKMLQLHHEGDPSRTSYYAKDYLMSVGDWYGEESSVILTRYLKELQRFTEGYDDLDKCHIKTQQTDGSEVGTIPFESALINGKGRYYTMVGNDTYEAQVKTPLEMYPVKKGNYYNFRVINPSLNYAFKIHIDQHKLTVTSSDGNPLEPVETDALIVHGGERYDFYIHADQPVDNYWIRVETTERYNGKEYDWDHPAREERPGIGRAILRYHGAPDVEPTSSTLTCTQDSRCTVINCPFVAYAPDEYSDCINYDQLKSLRSYKLPPVNQSAFEEHFLDFHFPRDKRGLLRSMVNGRQFVAPSTPPQVLGHAEYDRPCTETCEEEPCVCTYQVNLTYGNMVQMTLISHVTPIPWEGIPASAHPVHLHGHHFYVMKVGYPEIDPVTKRYVRLNPDIHCPTGRCSNATWSNKHWLNGQVPGLNEVNPPLKDTVTVPAGGYVVIRFMADNPGWWIMHCHLELHQVEGMALIIQEGHESLMNPPPQGFPTCGTFKWDSRAFWEKLKHKPGHNKPTTSPEPMPSGGVRTTGTLSAILGIVMLFYVCVPSLYSD